MTMLFQSGRLATASASIGSSAARGVFAVVAPPTVESTAAPGRRRGVGSPGGWDVATLAVAAFPLMRSSASVGHS